MCDSVALSCVRRRYKPRLHTERDRERQALGGVDIEKSIVVVVVVDRQRRATALSGRMIGRSMAPPFTGLTRSSAVALEQRMAPEICALLGVFLLPVCLAVCLSAQN